jgi:hypothetical protein
MPPSSRVCHDPDGVRTVRLGALGHFADDPEHDNPNADDWLLRLVGLVRLELGGDNDHNSRSFGRGHRT